MLTTLTLKPEPSAVGESVAWFLPGDDPARWLEEIATWPVPIEMVELYVCADSQRGSTAAVLAIPSEAMRLPPGGRGHAFRRAAPGVFAPVDAQIWPPVTADELRAAARFPVLIFHPSMGLTGCELSDRRGAWDFLVAPPPVREDWNRAVAGEARPPGLRAVHLTAAGSIDDIFGPESAEIGREPLDALPSAPDEPSTRTSANFARSAAALLVKALLGALSVLPRNAKAPTWLNALEGWAKRRLTGVARDLEQIRHRELYRLRDLLERDPEEGLRHAIPLAALAHRGVGPASGRLGTRSIEFNLSRLGGGRPADFWQVPSNLRASLATRYRELAMQELKLGRFRRAAFIFAELLGDLSAAADALRQGRHFREAAALYQDRLHNPLAAAGCLAEAGLILEALAIYEKMERWIEAAELYARLGDIAAEHAAVQKAVATHLAKGDPVAAARLVDGRLDDPDGAIELLAKTWPAGKQAIAALEERFAILARRVRADEARRLVADLVCERTPLLLLAPLANLLATTVERSTDARLRHTAADAVRVKAASGLAGRSLEGADEIVLLRAVARTAPDDRLLASDVQKFREARRARAPVVSGATAPSLVRRIVPGKAGEFNLGGVGSWSRAWGESSGLHAVARTPERTIVYARSSWERCFDRLEWADPNPDRGALFILQPHESSVILSRPFAPRLALETLPPLDAIGGEASSVGTPDWLPEDTVQVANSRFTLWVARAVGERVVLDAFENRTLIGSRDVTDDLTAASATGGGTSLTLAAQSGSGAVALGYGQHVLVELAGGRRVRDLGARVTSVFAVTPGGPSGWVALLEQGAVFVALDGASHTTIDDQLRLPRGCVLEDGRLILIGGEEGVIIRLQSGRVVRLGWFPFPDGPGIAVLATNARDVFAVVTEAGRVQRWRLPA